MNGDGPGAIAWLHTDTQGAQQWFTKPPLSAVVWVLLSYWKLLTPWEAENLGRFNNRHNLFRAIFRRLMEQFKKEPKLIESEVWENVRDFQVYLANAG